MGTWPGMARYDYNVPSFTKSLSWPPIHSGLWYHMVPIPAIMPCFAISEGAPGGAPGRWLVDFTRIGTTPGQWLGMARDFTIFEGKNRETSPTSP